MKRPGTYKKDRRMKIKALRVHQSIKVGTREHAFMKDTEFDMELSPASGLVRVVEKRTGATTFTSLMNIPWFTAEETKKVEKDEQEKSTKNTGRNKAKK